MPEPALAPDRPTAAPQLAVEIAGIRFAHPVLAAPGPLGFGREARATTDLRAFAGFITKSVTLDPRGGNPLPHLVKVEGGYLNSLGLPNPGIAGFLLREMPFLRTLGIPVIVSVAGHSVTEFVTLARLLSAEPGVAAVELNVSCPNVEAGLTFGVDPRLTAELVSAVREAATLPIWVKLTPNVTDIAVIARAAEDAGAHALTVANTLIGTAVDVRTRRSRLGTIAGGLSGPAIRPVAVYLTWRVASASRLPVIGAGGIATAEHALEFLIAGARAVAVGTAVIDNPRVAEEIRSGLAAYLEASRARSLEEIIGSLGERGGGAE
ncbi:MAG: dihydroorotate dehydrogenase [Armatimonadota bacterium]|nr:dihydroorotate dehydrogenase [Armatimonadota bacterium]MDR7452050.1 dihydroorotate dehydrogenase [Armatimonadota bacterium]MDR7466512.1 dihydroorotate dehydrogenase [Armatimonadota bacterium]MDR7493234.1 dihydroorotate dehydrogenase [Armatimonadota bacterium]MDR7504708.1 dihydroorotate dehydrogenase [Armatimonadota bacterium]